MFFHQPEMFGHLDMVLKQCHFHDSHCVGQEGRRFFCRNVGSENPHIVTEKKHSGTLA